MTTALVQAPRRGRNVASNVAFALGSSLLALWYVPYLVDRLGVAALGVVALANALVLYVAVMTDAMETSVNRHLTIDLARGDARAVSATFNTALCGTAGGALLLLGPGLVAAWLAPQWFAVPAEATSEARLLLGAVLVLVLLDVAVAAFRVPLFARERFDLRNLVRGGELVVRTAVVVLLVELTGARLWHVALGFLVGALVAASGTVAASRHVAPELRIRPQDASWERLRRLGTFGGWQLVNRLGMLLFLGTDVLLVNLYLGATATGIYGTLVLLPELLRRLSDTVASVLAPNVLARWAVDDVTGLRTLALRSVTLFGLVLALPVGLLCGLAQPLLDTWLGAPFAGQAPLVLALVVHLAVNLATLPLSFVLMANDLVRVQGLWTLGLGLLNTLLVVAVLGGAGQGTVAVAACTGVVFTVRSVAVVARHGARLLQVPFARVGRPLLAAALLTPVVALLSAGAWQVAPTGGWSGLLLSGTAVGLVHAAALWRWALTPQEQAAVGRALRQRAPGSP